MRRADLAKTVNQAMRIQVLRSVLLNQVIAAQAGINPTDLQCLNLLTLEGPMTPSRLAEAMAMTKGGAITAMVDRLEKAGYLRRVRDVRDRRQVLVEIIWEEPLHRLMAYYEPVGDALAGVLADYTDEELDLITEFTARGNIVLNAVVNAFSKPASRAATGPTVTPR
ncbi:MAG: MarR family transcriptional regulator [Pseudonocardiaceae bacterium]